jgi:hypothetical protein
MSKQFNTNKFKYFVLNAEISAKGGSINFRTYTDHANALGKGTGVGVQYIEGVDDKGRARGKWFELSQSRRTFIVREGQKDTQGISMYDFLKNSPDCEGSPNAQPNSKPLYREMNEAQDAKVALSSSQNRIKAAASALDIDPETMIELAAHIGYFESADELMRHRVVEWAEKRPEDYFAILNSGDRRIRALIRKGISDGLLTMKGPVIHWNTTVLGNNEDAAVAKLVAEKSILQALEDELDFKVDTKKTKKK